MKKGLFKGWRNVFSFTLNKSIRSKSFIAVTIIFALIFLVGVFAATALPGLLSDDEALPVAPERVIVCDTTTTVPDTAWLTDAEGGIYNNVVYSYASSVADADAQATGKTLILFIQSSEDGYSLEVLRPSDGELDANDADSYRAYVEGMFRYELMRRAGVDPSILEGFSYSVNEIPEIPITDEDTDPYDSLRSIIEMVVSYITIFVMYFMILIYGQGAANSVMLEKTSKLMDFFLVSVKPSAMILGKVLATALAAIIQISVWLAGAVGGYLGGRLTLNTVLGDAAGPSLADTFSQLSGLFTPGGIVVAVLVIIAGFLLYCSLAAIGGAMASKPEDLSSTNSVFAMLLVISFLLSLYSGGGSGGMVSAAKWLIYFPFTAILVTPGRAISGSISLLEGGISFALVALTALVVILAAGKVYTLMSFWRGNPPTPVKMFGIVRDSLKKDKK